MARFGEVITAPQTIVMMLAEALTKGVTPEQFRRKPQGIDTNSAAFNFGHLAVYPERILEMIGRTDIAKPDQKYVDWFSQGKTCLDDPEGKVYPPMNEIMERFYSRYRAAVEAVKSADDSVFDRPNPSPNERFRTMLPTVGAALAFMLDGHCQMHLGQVSTWRRCMGLPSAM